MQSGKKDHKRRIGTIKPAHVAALVVSVGIFIQVAQAASSRAAVPDNPVLAARFQHEPQRPPAGAKVVFDASASSGRNGAMAGFEWDFGDHSRAWTTSPNWTHTYMEPGEYTVTLTVTDRGGSSGSTTAILTVTARQFMLTFDDGPATESTPYILDQLRRLRKADGSPVKAGFFVVGQDKSQTIYHDIWQPKYGIHHDPGVVSHPDLVRQMAQEGHVVAIHTQHHPDLDRLAPAQVEREILDCYQAILDAGVTPPKVFRSPRMHDPNTLPPALQGRWRIVRGELTKDYLPLITEEEVIDQCRQIIQAAPTSPVVLVFHDFRGLPGHRLDFTKIVRTLVDKDHFVLVDFDAEAAVAASRSRPPQEQTYEDLGDLLKVWRRRLTPEQDK